MGRRIDAAFGKFLHHLAAQWIDLGNSLDRVAEKLDPDRSFVIVGREYLDDVTSNPEGASVEINVVPLVLYLYELF
jgi:hypothetical protein